MNKTMIGHNCDQCERVFKSAPALRMHKLRSHGRGWNTVSNLKRKKTTKTSYPSSDPAYKKRKYQEKVRWNHAHGLNAHGEPLKFPRNMSASEAMKASWARRKAQKKNGAVPAPVESDPIGEAARAIMIAAKVLRGTMHSLKLP